MPTIHLPVKLTYIVWEDSAFMDGYTDEENALDDAPYMIHSAGVFVSENDTYVAISVDFYPRNHDDRFRHITWIPKSQIKARQDRIITLKYRGKSAGSPQRSTTCLTKSAS